MRRRPASGVHEDGDCRKKPPTDENNEIGDKRASFPSKRILLTREELKAFLAVRPSRGRASSKTSLTMQGMK